MNSADAAQGRAALKDSLVKMSVVMSVQAAFSFARGTLFTLAGERVVARLRRRLFRSIIAQVHVDSRRLEAKVLQRM